jgi:small basic protein (TIGR04137 family)
MNWKIWKYGLYYLFHRKFKAHSTASKYQGDNTMSLHPSLKTKGSVGEKRNVLKRYERIDKLKAEGRYKDGDRAWGLPKTKPAE